MASTSADAPGGICIAWPSNAIWHVDRVPAAPQTPGMPHFTLCTSCCQSAARPRSSQAHQCPQGCLRREAVDGAASLVECPGCASSRRSLSRPPAPADWAAQAECASRKLMATTSSGPSALQQQMHLSTGSCSIMQKHWVGVFESGPERAAAASAFGLVSIQDTVVPLETTCLSRHHICYPASCPPRLTYRFLK